jgi:hypothetical protein
MPRGGFAAHSRGREQRLWNGRTGRPVWTGDSVRSAFGWQPSDAPRLARVLADSPLGLARVLKNRADHDQTARGPGQLVGVRPAVPAHPHAEVLAIVRVALQVVGEALTDPFRVPSPRARAA